METIEDGISESVAQTDEAKSRMEQPPARIEHASDRTADTTARQATPV